MIEITKDGTKDVVAQLKFNGLVKWDPETKGIVLGSWIKMDIEKPRGAEGEMVPVLSFLSSKNKKGFMYLAKIKESVKKQQVESVTC